MPAHSRPLRASVTANNTGLVAGDPCEVLVDGSDTPCTANGLAHYLPTPGDRLLVQRVGDVVEVMQFLSRGTVPWINSDADVIYNGLLKPGQQIVGGAADASGPRVAYDNTGVTAYNSLDNPTFVVDAETGDVSMVGELGTALPGDPGIFFYNLNFQRFGDKVVTHPVGQWNIGATRDQPSIQADPSYGKDGGGSGIAVFSGSTTNGHESVVRAGQGEVFAGVEKTADDGAYDGGQMWLRNDYGFFGTDYTLTDATWRGKIQFDDVAAFCGYEQNGNGHLRGMQCLKVSTVDIVRLLSANHTEITNTDASAYNDIWASNVTFPSDSSAKTNQVPVTGALEAVKAMPVYDYDTPHGSGQAKEKRTRGVMAQDVQKVLPAAVQQGTLGLLGVSAYDLIGTLIAAVQELAAEVEGLKATKPGP